ncbi:MAG: acyltransferase, partial [Acidobacteriota bacterium]|nr:acyltransferase [Acidobacteriota bacterium]
MQPVRGLESGLSSPQIPVITGLRAIAVFLVILYHSEMVWIPGGLGVLMFFVISGFLITWLLLKENERTGTVSLKHFYARRSLRIFPAFYLYALIAIASLAIFWKPIPWPSAAASLLYVENYFQALYGDPGTAFSHTWSLGVEEQFYLLWPLLFLAIRNRITLLIRIPVAIIACVWIYRPILKFGLHVWQGYFYEAFESRMDHLLIGCLLAILLYSARNHKAWNLVCGRLWYVACNLGLLVLSYLTEFRFHDAYRDSIGFIVNPVLCALLIPQLISVRDSVWVRWLDWAPVRYLGLISYSLYLYQQIILGPVRKIMHSTPYP